MFFTEKWKAWKRWSLTFADHQSQYRKTQHQPLFLEPLEDRLVLSNGILAPGADPSTSSSLTSPSSPSPSPSSTLSPATASAPALSGTWATVKAPPPGSVGTMFLLPNGDIMAQGPGVSNTWYELTPDASGSYASGSWSPLASMSLQRLYTGSEVLSNDKVFILGGEYSGPLGLQNIPNSGEIYNIATNTWSPTPNFPQSNFGDDPTTVLPNGDVLAGYIFGPQTYLYHPATNTWSPGPTKLDSDRSDEETWVQLPASATLPQGGILTYSIFASDSNGRFMGQVYNIATNSWTETQNSLTNPPQQLSSFSVGFELGGAAVLPNGMVFQLGANGNTALYDPSTNTWSAGPQIKDGSGALFGADDAPMSILPDGHVVFSADAGPISTFSPPTKMFDYDYTTNTITEMTGLPASMTADLTNPLTGSAFVGRTLVLPNGQLLFNTGSHLWVFTPRDSAQSAWQPTITGLVNHGGGSYTLSGTQLSGISEGSSYGDDVNVSENYPIVQLTDSSSGNVYYATTSNWSTKGVSAVGDATVQTVDFTLPAGLPNSTYDLRVVASGIASQPLTVIAPAAPALVVAQSASTTYRASSQTVALSATVTADVGNQTVGEGKVTFTIKDTNGRTIGTPVAANVVGGTANANYILPANVPVGVYFIDVSYTDTFGNFLDDGADTKSTLTINGAGVTATAQDTSTAFNSLSQIVPITAAVSDGFPSDSVAEGQVAFIVKDSDGNPIGTSLPASVVAGVATAFLTVPAGQPIGTYTIDVSYTDSQGNFSDNGDTSAALTIGPDLVDTTAVKASTIFSPNTQSVTLNATLANSSIPNNTVNEGTVTFTLTNGSTTVGSAPGNVSNGKASADFNVPGGLAAGTYTIDVSYSDSQGNFADQTDTSAAFTVAPANVTTTAGNASAVFSTNAQTVTLNANLTDIGIPGDTVGEGTVTFTVMNGTAIVGAPVQGTVSGNKASAAFTVPTGLAVGNYTVEVAYTDSQGNFIDKTDNSAAFTVSPANVTATASNLATVFGPNAQSLTLNATVANTSLPSNTVEEGTVTFTIQNGGTTLGSVQGTVSGGTASAAFALPAAQTAGNYTIAVSYSDSQGHFTDTGDTNATLAVAPVQVTTTVGNTTASFNTGAQTLSLHATVVDASNTNPSIDEGNVIFIIRNGSSIVGSVQSAVSAGAANAAFTLPAGLAPGSYTLAVHYQDSQGNFIDTADGNAVLLLNPAASNAVLTQVLLTPNLIGQTATETLTAHVGSSTAVAQGTVTFTLSNLTISAPVDANGNATASVTLPMAALLGPQGIGVKYVDPANDLTGSNDSQTAAWQPFNALLPSTAAFSDDSRDVSTAVFALMLTFRYNALGLLTEVDVGPFQLAFNYNANNVLTMVTMNGLPLLVV